jgi:hypothetical protein
MRAVMPLLCRPAFSHRHPPTSPIHPGYPEGLRAEIGSTWYRKRVPRSPLNSECKLLLLTHAFDQLNCIAVEFRRSRVADG